MTGKIWIANENSLLLKREKFAVSLRKEQKKKILNAKRQKLMVRIIKPLNQQITATSDQTNGASQMQTDGD